VKKNIHELAPISEADYATVSIAAEGEDVYLSKDEMHALVERYTAEMKAAAAEMEFEKAAELRDKILALKDMDLGLKPAVRGLLERPAGAATGSDAVQKGRGGRGRRSSRGRRRY